MLGDFEPAFEALVEEGGADGAGVIEFGMAIIGIAEAELDGIEHAAAGIDLAAQIDAVLLDLEPHGFAVPRRQVKARRHAVEAVVMAIGKAEFATGIDEGRAAACWRLQ